MSRNNLNLPAPDARRKRLTALRWALRRARASAAEHHAKATAQDATVADLEAKIARLSAAVEAEEPGALARMHDVSRGAS